MSHGWNRALRAIHKTKTAGRNHVRFLAEFEVLRRIIRIRQEIGNRPGAFANLLAIACSVFRSPSSNACRPGSLTRVSLGSWGGQVSGQQTGGTQPHRTSLGTACQGVIHGALKSVSAVQTVVFWPGDWPEDVGSSTKCLHHLPINRRVIPDAHAPRMTGTWGVEGYSAVAGRSLTTHILRTVSWIVQLPSQPAGVTNRVPGPMSKLVPSGSVMVPAPLRIWQISS